jgi:hypothetical protein
LLGEKSGSLTVAAKHIKAGVSAADETAQVEYLEARMAALHLAARDADNVGGIKTGGEQGSPMDDGKLEVAFNNGFHGRDTGGKSWAE